MKNPFLKISFNTNSIQPCLTIVGVGPGDPSLLTLAAIQAIKKANLIAYPIADNTSNSMAAEIVFEFIKRKKKLPLYFPMVTDPSLLREALEKSSSQLVNALEQSKKVVFISQGDISLYSTGAYIASTIKSKYPNYKLKLIPGVNSYSAAAAKGIFPLALQKEQLLILPAPENKSQLELLLDDAIRFDRVIVFLKLGSKWIWIREVLKERGLLDKTLFAKRVGTSDEEIIMANDIPRDSKSYFSLLIIRTTFK